MKFIQNTNTSIGILFEFHTEFLFESNNSLLIHKPQSFPAIFSSPPRAFKQLEFVLGLQ